MPIELHIYLYRNLMINIIPALLLIMFCFVYLPDKFCSVSMFSSFPLWRSGLETITDP